MPRVYKKKGTKNDWTNEQLREAVEKVKTKELTLRAAALTTGYPGVHSLIIYAELVANGMGVALLF